MKVGKLTLISAHIAIIDMTQELEKSIGIFRAELLTVLPAGGVL
jgi:hypothetical protein